MYGKKEKHGFFIVLLFFIALLDRITKIIALRFIGQDGIFLNDSVFSFIRVPSAMALASAGVLFLVCLGWIMMPKKRSMVSLALLFVLLGIGSNLTDRVMYGGVVDWIHIPGISIFNLADVSIIGGVVFLFFDLFKKDRKIV